MPMATIPLSSDKTDKTDIVQVTHTALLTADIVKRIISPKINEPMSAFRRIVCQLMLFFQQTYQTVFNFEDPPLHDPCAVAYVVAPELFQTERLRVDIETTSALTSGQTVCDIWRQSGLSPNVAVVQSMNIPKFWDLVIAAIDKADRVSHCNRP
ncbi:hypothetical protein CBR_g57530 [Chara braunii]|uniref:Inosine/uridine-preferring nucleoside hydrolase domain-containing protein n=1 Tax=Chara braunii TaxID=69332 RepID=A0A388ME64_CHABU|nr:hypothetical protein CBR_g57530 [Chara braunii]|eukprot:GBG92851.1 hypothetical protein CBR_g57530 [Chara braunii]